MKAAYNDIINDLSKKIYHPLYLLEGDEPYFIDKISGFIENNILTETEKSFNLTTLYGKDIDGIALLDIVKRYPMMANYQVVIVKEAQHLKNLDKLEPYIENPLKSTILVLCYKGKTIDKRTKFAKLLGAKAIVFTSKKLYENQIAGWIDDYLRKLGYRITPKAAALLTEYLGNNLSKVTNEIEKLTLNIPENHEIGDNEVEKYIGISKDYNVFEFQNALGKRNEKRSYQIVNYFINNPKANPLVVIIGTLYKFFSSIYLLHHNKHLQERELAGLFKVNPYFVKDFTIAGSNYNLAETERIIGVLQEYDLKSKGINNVNVKEGELLREMTYKILNSNT